MRLLPYLLSLVLSLLVSVESRLLITTTPEVDDSPAIIKLKDYVNCGYDVKVIPIKNPNEALNVSIRIVLKSVTYDMHSSTMSVHSWFALTWLDYHFKWEPENFGNIKTYHASSDSIWTPDISVFNRADYDTETSAYHPIDCIIYNTGSVICVPPSRSDALCQADLTKYPFDVQNCTLKLASWTFSGDHINFALMKPAVTTEDFVQQGEWRIKKIVAEKVEKNMTCCPDYSHPTLLYHFLIERNSGAHVCMIVVPAIAMIMISLLTLCLSPEEKSRIGIISLNLIVHLLYLQYLSWQIPVSGLAAPLILVFARDSFLLSALVLVLTAIQKTLIRNKSTCPEWISKTTSNILTSRIGFYIFLFDENSKDVRNVDPSGHDFVKPTEKRNEEEWLSLSRLLDKIFLLTYSIVYAGMFTLFVM